MSISEPIAKPGVKSDAPPAKGVSDVRTGGWFVRISVAVIVIPCSIQPGQQFACSRIPSAPRSGPSRTTGWH